MVEKSYARVIHISQSNFDWFRTVARQKYFETYPHREQGIVGDNEIFCSLRRIYDIS